MKIELSLDSIRLATAKVQAAKLIAIGIAPDKVTKLIPIPERSEADHPSSIELENNHQYNSVDHLQWDTDGGPPIDLPAKSIDLPIAKQVYHPPVVWQDKLSAEQRAAVDYFKSGKSGCLIGKAGTGKTTTVKEYIREMVSEHLAVPISDIDGHKHLKQFSLGVVCCAFTNKAINNISKSFDLSATQINFMTIHKLLEYIKEDFQIIDPDTKELRNSFRFVPSRNRERKLPYGLHTIVIEEASMVSIDLYSKLIDACHSGIQFIFLGDLQQLPPPYGDGILGYKLNELPCFELTKIYRQAAENPIISLAWDIASGKDLPKKILEAEYHTDKSLSAAIRFTFFDKKISWEYATITMSGFFCTLIDRGIFNPELDIILVPYNKQLGSIALNAKIAQHISESAGKETYEIIAGFQKFYYAIGDKVLVNKKEGYITKITKNAKYLGKAPMPASVDLHRDGMYHAKSAAGVQVSPEEGMSEEQLNSYLLAALASNEDDVTNQASHVLTIQLVSEQMEDGSNETTCSTRGEYAPNNLILAYAITVHKAQGSEWNKVFLLLHNSHHQANREMLYTAVTRASKQLFVMCESDSFEKIIPRQKIPGVTLQEKILWFKTKIEEMKRKVEEQKKKGVVKPVQFEEDE